MHLFFLFLKEQKNKEERGGRNRCTYASYSKTTENKENKKPESNQVKKKETYIIFKGTTVRLKTNISTVKEN